MYSIGDTATIATGTNNKALKYVEGTEVTIMTEPDQFGLIEVKSQDGKIYPLYPTELKGAKGLELLTKITRSEFEKRLITKCSSKNISSVKLANESIEYFSDGKRVAVWCDAIGSWMNEVIKAPKKAGKVKTMKVAPKPSKKIVSNALEAVRDYITIKGKEVALTLVEVKDDGKNRAEAIFKDVNGKTRSYWADVMDRYVTPVKNAK